MLLTKKNKKLFFNYKLILIFFVSLKNIWFNLILRK